MSSTTDEEPDVPVRRRRRPAYRSGRPTLTREGIAKAALDVLADGGPAGLTMRAVAARLGVSARALYNYVTDRDSLLQLIVSVSQAARPAANFDPACWQDSLRHYCHDLRAWYRAHPGLLALARAEDLTTFAAPETDKAVVDFFLAIGLSAEDAYRAWAITVLQVAGFAEIWDGWHDRPPPGTDPAAWHRHEPATASTEPDQLFESALDMLVAGIAAMR
ncbi:TetR/AcrR family transcriptional regulator [Nonomuraea basaltis]|uniref:TetR/AcrR family transcriptional regulator n=1 Tax=Nonomuraea basaltis TaxID=2495887 RepID=UPI001486B146|nr:TetR/AcrR family transcriptional regulator [Nonomuraea basaltis]